MLSLAKERAEQIGAKATFAETDATEFRSQLKFSGLVSRFGVMFFADPVKAFDNLRNQMEERAPLVFACWRAAPENEWVMLPFQAALGFLDGPPPTPEPRAPGPFAFAESDYVTHILDSAGWKNVWVEEWDGSVTMPGDDVSETAEFTLTIGPLARLIAEQGIDREKLKSKVIELLEEKVSSDDQVRLKAAAWIVTASA